MALTDKLLISWNFDTVTTSDSSGESIVDDTQNTFSGKIRGLTPSSSDFLAKEDIKTNKKIYPDVIEGVETIQTLEQDDPRIDLLKKPSVVKLMIENSMNQIVSDDMLNMFLVIEQLAFLYAESSYKYKTNYNRLDDARHEYFSKVLTKIDFERYIEFYKWIDSSLGYMLNQLKPQNAIADSTLRPTIESHILERNKYTYPLPLTIQPQRVFTDSVTVVRSTAGITGSNLSDTLSGTFDKTVSTRNIQDFNYRTNLEVVQTAGKIVNNRGNKTNKTVIQTKFSTADGLSEYNRDTSGEFSVYNDLNQKSGDVRAIFNISESQATGNLNQGRSSNFMDNNFVQRAVPYTASNYYSTTSVDYVQIPDATISALRSNNTIFNGVREPVIEHNPPIVHKLRINGALEDVEVLSPYSNKLDTLTKKTINSTGSIAAINPKDNLYKRPETTFFYEAQNLSDSLEFKRIEHLENIFPEKHLMGMNEIRNKPNYEEEIGTFNSTAVTWSQNSYNNNTADIRTFWKDNLTDRYRSRGTDTAGTSGSINCLDQINRNEDQFILYGKGLASSSYEDNLFKVYDFQNDFQRYKLYTFLGGLANPDKFFSVFAMDSSSSLLYGEITASFVIPNPPPPTIVISTIPRIIFNNSNFGDIGAFPHAEMMKFILMPTGSKAFFPTPKPTFIHTVYPGWETNISQSGTGNESSSLNRLYFKENVSYQGEIDPNIRPFYNSYYDFKQNIKHESQNRSIIPEFMVSNFDNIVLGRTTDYYNNQNYLKVLGREDYDEINQGDFIVDFNKFINKKSNKIKIVFDGIKKLLPYNGFYPQQRTVQIVKDFYKSYLSGAVTSSRELQSAIQPFFAPGILFNTIKAGIALDWPAVFKPSEALVTASQMYTQSYAPAVINGIQNSFSDADDTYYVLSSSAQFTRLPFESLLDPKYYFISSSNKFLAYLDPTHYSKAITTRDNSTQHSGTIFPSVDTQKITVSASLPDTYKYSINNFLAETANFFLRNQQLTSFVSKPESEFLSVSSSKQYGMDIIIEKKDNFSMFYGANYGENTLGLPFVSLFGPPSRYILNSVAALSETGYLPYSPPYYVGGAGTPQERRILKLRYTPSSSFTPKLADIISGITIEDTIPTTTHTVANAMRLASCLNYTSKIRDIQTTFNATNGNPIEASIDKQDKWVIQTKFETPLINYAGTITETPIATAISAAFFISASSGEADGTARTGVSASIFSLSNNLDGIWNSLGEIPEDNQSVQLKITDEGIENSLLKICGFNVEEKSIGVLADQKTISEAVVLVPHSLKPLRRSISAGLIRNTYNITERFYVFPIKREKINQLLNVADYRALSIEQIKIILEKNPNIDRSNSIIDLMIKMVNYNIPPHLNWLLNKTIIPFVMYIAEFTHELSKQDLSNIWQGTMPDIAQVPESETVVVEHFLNENELFGDIDISVYNIKMKVFKVKKRANISYFDLTADVEDNKKYDFGRGAGNIPWYSYNWPYDYFSLVELLNIQAGEVEDNENTSSTGVT